MLQQAAATAALAIDGRTTVQAVDYPKLRARLLADGQVLEWRPEASGREPPSRLTQGEGR